MQSEFPATPATYDWNNQVNNTVGNDQKEELKNQLQTERNEIDMHDLNNIQLIYGREQIIQNIFHPEVLAKIEQFVGDKMSP